MASASASADMPQSSFALILASNRNLSSTGRLYTVTTLMQSSKDWMTSFAAAAAGEAAAGGAEAEGDKDDDDEEDDDDADDDAAEEREFSFLGSKDTAPAKPEAGSSINESLNLINIERYKIFRSKALQIFLYV